MCISNFVLVCASVILVYMYYENATLHNLFINALQDCTELY